jgi:hypothetical protein
MINPARHGLINFGGRQFVFVRKPFDSAPNRVVAIATIDLQAGPRSRFGAL